jgi:ELWxxDGT repeat protein
MFRRPATRLPPGSLARAAAALFLALVCCVAAAGRLTLAEVQMPDEEADFVRLGTQALFAADDGIHGEEPWITDGTPAGTRLLLDLNPGPSGSSPRFAPAPVGGELVFAADDGVHGREPWATAGTAASTRRLADLQPGAVGSDPVRFLLAGERLYFSAHTDVHGRELRMRDATGPIMLVHDLCPGACSSNPARLVSAGSHVYFTAYTDPTATELGVSDGTAAGTRLIDVNPGPHSSAPNQLSPITSARVMFSAFTPDAGYEVWLSDGSASGTVRLGEIEPGATPPQLELQPLGSAVLVAATTAAYGRELWRCTPALGGYCGLLRDIVPAGSADVSSLTRVAGATPQVLFAATTAAHGRELWRSDGTSGGTYLVRDLHPGASGSFPQYLRELDGHLHFAAHTGSGYYEVWRSDGSAAGTRRVDAAQFFDPPRAFQRLGERLLLVEHASNGTAARRLPVVLTPDLFKHGFEP